MDNARVEPAPAPQYQPPQQQQPQVQMQFTAPHQGQQVLLPSAYPNPQMHMHMQNPNAQIQMQGNPYVGNPTYNAAAYATQVGLQMNPHMHPQQQQQMAMAMQMAAASLQRPEPPWMERPSGILSCPEGLEYLSQLDQVLIKQKKELLEMMTGIEMKNKYQVQNSLGQRVYYAKESSDTCMRQCCGSQRPFELSIEDNFGKEVIHVSRPYKCMCCHQACSCSKCCFDQVTVEAPPGNKVGKVSQVYDCCQVKYHILDENDSVVLIIDGPSYTRCYCPGDDIPFHLMAKDRVTEIGRVSRQWTNLIQEYFTDADNFGITFPMDLDVRMKAVILGACFLIDFMFFEHTGGRGAAHRHR